MGLTEVTKCVTSYSHEGKGNSALVVDFVASDLVCFTSLTRWSLNLSFDIMDEHGTSNKILFGYSQERLR